MWTLRIRNQHVSLDCARYLFHLLHGLVVEDLLWVQLPEALVSLVLVLPLLLLHVFGHEVRLHQLEPVVVPTVHVGHEGPRARSRLCVELEQLSHRRHRVAGAVGFPEHSVRGEGFLSGDFDDGLMLLELLGVGHFFDQRH